MSAPTNANDANAAALRAHFDAMTPYQKFQKLLAIYTLLDQSGRVEDAENAYFEQFVGDETGFQHEPQTLVHDFIGKWILYGDAATPQARERAGDASDGGERA